MPTIVNFGGGIPTDDYNALVSEYNAYKSSHSHTDSEYNTLNSTYTTYKNSHSHTNDQYNTLQSNSKYNANTLKTGSLSATNTSGNAGSGTNGPSSTWKFKFADNIIPVTVKLTWQTCYPSQAFSLNFNGKEIYYSKGRDIGPMSDYANSGYALASTLTGITSQSALAALAGKEFTFYNRSGGALNRPSTVTCVEWYEKQ